jgi:hypothetical protein
MLYPLTAAKQDLYPDFLDNLMPNTHKYWTNFIFGVHAADLRDPRRPSKSGLSAQMRRLISILYQ